MTSTRPWELSDPRAGAIAPGVRDQPDTEAIKRSLVPYGIYHIDKAALTGLNVEKGEFLVIQGPEGQRKTTLALNMVGFWCRHGKLPPGTCVVVETLESGMDRQKYIQHLVAMEATRYILLKHYGDPPKLPITTHSSGQAQINMRKIRQELHNELIVSVDFMMVEKRSKLQQRAIEYACDTVATWPLVVYGAPKREGLTRELFLNGGGHDFRQEPPYARWVDTIEKYNAKIIIVDHLQGYAVPSGFMALEEIVNRAATLVSEQNVVFIGVSQVSLGSMRDAKQGGTQYARGGKRAAEEANKVLNVEYSPTTDAMRDQVIIKPGKFRGNPPPAMIHPMDRASGLFIGRSAVLEEGQDQYGYPKY